MTARCTPAPQGLVGPGALPALRAAAIAALAALGPAALAQTWTPVAHNAPAPVNLMLLLPDGTVMAANNNGTQTIGRAWYRLTPDIHGSYVNGTWSTLASMIDTRLYYSAQVLRDGRVFVAGGEYGTGGPRAEVYNPATNTWTAAPVPTSLLNPAVNSPITGLPQQFYDSNSEILPDGRVIITPVCPRNARQTVIYDPATNTWADGPQLFRGNFQDEASWVKLADSTILTIDPFGTNSERFNPASNSWINDAIVPTQMYDSFGSELGAAFLLPNGHAFFLGATGHTALYTPSGSTAMGSWIAGTNIPLTQGTPDAPAAMLVTGHILCAVSPVPTSANHFPTPTRFYEYDYVTNSFTGVNAPNGTLTDNISSYKGAMLDLPDGSVMYSHFGVDTYIYRPAGPPLAQGKPVVSTITQNGDGSYHLTGTGLNGISEGAAYGDDLQMASNYPLVRLSDPAGNIYYARTYNWSSTGVMTGAQVVTTEFRLPAGLPAAADTLTVVTNGIASDPNCLNAPQVTSSPTSLTRCEGTAFPLSAAGAGRGALTYQWQLMTTTPGTWESIGNDPAPLACGGTASATPFNTASTSITIAGCHGPFQVRVIVSNACGSATSDLATLSVNSADFNGDGDVGTDTDIEAFFACISGACCATCGTADFDGDGNLGTDADIEAFFRVLAGGAC